MPARGLKRSLTPVRVRFTFGTFVSLRQAGRYFAYRHFWFVFVPLVGFAVLAMVVSFGYADETMGAADKRSMALFSGFTSTVCVGVHIANNGFRVRTP